MIKLVAGSFKLPDKNPTYFEQKTTKKNTMNFVLQAEQRADMAERTMAKLQKECDRLEGIKITKLKEKTKSLLTKKNCFLVLTPLLTVLCFS